MSNIYHTEPPTSGKVVIHTTFGDIDIELWPKEAPLACRNFIQLALEGYYDNTVVHRVIKNFMVQMGDPTGTGAGGESIWGKPFKDEVHGRIKFNHRGQVAMANSNKPNSNQSQFFITLDSCDWLQGKHTIFGKVTGNTIYNVTRMGEVEVGEMDRPVDDIRILRMEVLLNPFEDIVPRVTIKADVALVVHNDKKSKGITAVAVKNSKLLSFGEDEDEDEEDASNRVAVKMKSIHDVKKRKNVSNTDSTVSTLSVGPSSIIRSHERSQVVESDGTVDDLQSRITQKERRRSSEETEVNAKKQQPHHDSDSGEDLLDQDAIERAMKRARREDGLKQKSQEFMQLRDELLRSRRAIHVLTGAEAATVDKELAFQEMVTPLEARRQKYIKRKAAHGDREEETMKRLAAFKSSIKSVKSAKASAEAKNESKEDIEVYRGQVLERNSDDEGEGLDDWHMGRLKFKKHIDDEYRLGADNLRVIDERIGETGGKFQNFKR